MMFRSLQLIKADLWHIRAAIRASREFARSAEARGNSIQTCDPVILL